MKKKILSIIVSLVLLVPVASVFAVMQGSNKSDENGQNQVQQQVQTSNQGESTQLQVQTEEQLQSGEISGQNSQNNSQLKDQNQNKAQGEESQSNSLGEQRRSRVANAVQEMLQIADRNGGIGEQVRVIAQAQNQNQEKLEASIEKVQKRGGLVKLLVGPDYTEIKNAKKILEQNREQIQQLNQVQNQFSNQDDKQSLLEQIQLLEQTNSEIEETVNNSERGFSLFGWMFKFFAR
ncbi:MAG: hypothetical protein PHW72_03205 [Candidatus Pacebacteria bacterium]|nr:hypothetical protein [Candidatus Paceibacterota bacterium]